MRTSILRSLTAAAGVALLVTATHGCSYAWTVTLDIEIADGVEIPEDATLVVIQTSQEPPMDERMPVDAPWGVADGVAVDLPAGERTHRYEGSTCCSPIELNYSWAFLDLDGNGQYDEGEPYGADPDNPVEVDANYAVTIVVDDPG